MEVKRWQPRPGQIWWARTRRSFSTKVRKLLRSSGTGGFLFWVALKLSVWSFWTGPILFLAVAVMIPFFVLLFLAVSLAYVFAGATKPFFRRPLIAAREVHLRARGWAESFAAWPIEVAFRPDDYLEQLT